jgi:hypothetical protein
VAIVRKRLGLQASLYTLLQVLSVTVFEKMPIQTALSGQTEQIDQLTEDNQLTLFAF